MKIVVTDRTYLPAVDAPFVVPPASLEADDPAIASDADTPTMAFIVCSREGFPPSPDGSTAVAARVESIDPASARKNVSNSVLATMTVRLLRPRALRLIANRRLWKLCILFTIEG
jgi:hypothetical protein